MKPQPATWIWAGRLKAAQKIWAQLRPHESKGLSRSVDGEFYFGSIREIAHGFEIGSGIEGLRRGADHILIRARGMLRDFRIVALSSFAEGSPITRYSLDFDVLAAHCFIKGKPLIPYPQIAQSAFEEEMPRILEMYSGMLSTLWEFFGGYDRVSFEKLALWALENSSATGLHIKAFDGAFAAFLYGASDRADQYLSDLERSWEDRLRNEPDNVAVQKVRLEVLEAIARARLIIG